MVKLPKVFVVILNYNSLQDTLLCIESVRKSDYKTFQLLVIDNASLDNSGETLSHFLVPDEFVKLPSNRGYAGGNNIGIEIALERGADYVFIINPDIRIPTNALSEYVSVMEEGSDIGVLSPLQLESWNGPFDKKFEESVIRQHGIFVSKSQAARSIFEVSHVLGAALFIRTQALRVVGGFDPLFFAYGEEEDFCRRALSKGIRIVVTTRAPVVHLRTNEKNFVSDHVLFLRTKGQYLLSLKNHQYPFMVLMIGVLTKAFMDFLVMSKKRYPFKYYPVTRRHVLHAIAWLLVHAPIIFLHRRMDLLYAPYLATPGSIA